MKLISIDEYTQMMIEKYNEDGRPNHTGIKCPECGEELVFSQKGVILTSYPPKTSVECHSCGYGDWITI